MPPSKETSVGAGRNQPRGRIVGHLPLLAVSTVVLSTVVTLVLLEFVARAVLSHPVPLYVPSSHFRLIYELNPQHEEINSFGMRQEDLEPSSLRRQFVIAVIGDSHAYGANSKNTR